MATTTDDDYPVLNARAAPCGGHPKGKAHFDAEMNTKIFVAWKIVHPDASGNCTLRLGSGETQGDLEVVRPFDKSDVNGKFPCGREQTNYEGKIVKLPANLSCDDCVLQVEWETHATGKQYMCSDIEILSGKIEDCAGQCTNGASCMNGMCKCRKGYSGTFCEIIETAPSNINYAMYLKYFLAFLIILIIAVTLLFLGSLLIKWADKQLQANRDRNAQRDLDN
jgi:hypothetical protein